MKKLVLIGAGGHCKSCIDVILQTQEYEIVAILGKKEELNKKILNYDINGTDDDFKKYIDLDCEFLITIGQIKNVEPRKNVFEALNKLNAKFATVVSPQAYVSEFSSIDQGSIVMHHAIVNAEAKIAKNCIINTKALIEHEVIIGSHCHISTAAIINGNVHIKQESFIGSNATIVHGKVIEKYSFIKAGTLVK